jgi:hypothetical protein
MINPILKPVWKLVLETPGHRVIMASGFKGEHTRRHGQVPGPTSLPLAISVLRTVIAPSVIFGGMLSVD